MASHLILRRRVFLNKRRDPKLEWYEAQVAEHQHRLFGFALYHLRSEDDARDVVQETLLRLWMHRDRVEHDTAGAWLTRVCRNACIDRLRRTKTRQGESALDEDRFADGAMSPDDRLHQDDLQRRVLALLDDLDEPFRSLVILRDIQDLSYEEIAAVMDLPLNTVKVYLHRARKRLRARLLDDVRHET
jgi:RNA polymerase sigma factor (sigma-70 family)